MRVTGSLQTKRGIYQMMARVIFDDGTVKQKCKTTGLRASRKTKSEADRMLVGYLVGHAKKNDLFVSEKAEFLVREAGVEPARPEWTLEPESCISRFAPPFLFIKIGEFVMK